MLILWVGVLSVVAQSSNTDSLRIELNHRQTQDTTYVILLCDYAESFDDKSYDSVLHHAKQAYQLATKLNYDKGKAYALWLQGMASYYLSKVDSAQLLLASALPFAISSNDTREEARIYNSLANAARYLGNNPTALDYYFKSLRIKERIHDEMGQAITLNNIGNVYSDQHEWARALPYYQQSLKLRKRLNRESTAIMLLSNLGENYLHVGVLDSAGYYLRRALNFAHPNADGFATVHIYYGMTNYFQARNQLDSAFYYTRQGMASAEVIASRDRQVLFLLKLGELYNLKQQFTEALASAEKAMGISEKPKRLNYVMQYEQIRSEAFSRLGKFKEAFESTKHFHQLNDSTQSKSYRDALRARELEYQLESEKVRAEADRVVFEQKENRSRVLQWMLAAITLGVAGVAFLLYRLVQIRTIANKRLEQKRAVIETQNMEIQAQNEELQLQGEEIVATNERLEELVTKRTSELHETIKKLTEQNQDLEQFSFITSHNLRAPLARIAGIVGLLKLSKSDPTELNTLIGLLEKTSKDFEEVIRDLSHIITLRKNVDFTREPIVLLEFVDTVLKFVDPDILITKTKINIQISADLKVYTIRPFLHSVLLNLISNAIKYRSSERTPEITIEATMRDGLCHCTVKDNGIGINLNESNSKKIFSLYNRFHPSIEGKGFGLYLVKTQLELMGGNISVESVEHESTEFRFFFPSNVK
jgi:signal transduction histidine kinase